MCFLFSFSYLSSVCFESCHTGNSENFTRKSQLIFRLSEGVKKRARLDFGEKARRIGLTGFGRAADATRAVPAPLETSQPDLRCARTRVDATTHGRAVQLDLPNPGSYPLGKRARRFSCHESCSS